MSDRILLSGIPIRKLAIDLPISAEHVDPPLQCLTGRLGTGSPRIYSVGNEIVVGNLVSLRELLILNLRMPEIENFYPLTSRPRYVIGDRGGRMPPKAVYERDPAEGSGMLVTIEAGTITGLLSEDFTRI